MKRKFNVEIIGSIEIELDDAVIARVDDDWRKTFYANVQTPSDIAEHITFAMLIRGFLFKQLDGFAGLPDDAAKLGEDEFELIATERSRTR